MLLSLQKSECDECDGEDCTYVETFKTKVCQKSLGLPCDASSDCKEGKQCLRYRIPTAEVKSTKVCLKPPFQCRKNSDCEDGRECVKSSEYYDYHVCLPRNAKCHSQRDCSGSEECLLMLEKGFAGLTWSKRCTVVPFRRCLKVPLLHGNANPFNVMLALTKGRKMQK